VKTGGTAERKTPKGIAALRQFLSLPRKALNRLPTHTIYPQDRRRTAVTEGYFRQKRYVLKPGRFLFKSKIHIFKSERCLSGVDFRCFANGAKLPAARKIRKTRKAYREMGADGVDHRSPEKWSIYRYVEEVEEVLSSLLYFFYLFYLLDFFGFFDFAVKNSNTGCRYWSGTGCGFWSGIRWVYWRSEASDERYRR
jgi:hypothetical protein